MKKLLTLLMAIALVFVPVKAFADEEVTLDYEIVEESDDYYEEDDDEFYDEYEDDYDDYDEDYDDEYDYDDDILTFDEQLDLVSDDEVEEVVENDNSVSLSVCNVVLLAVVPFIAGLLIGAGVMLLSYKTVQKEAEAKQEKKKENKKNDK